MGTTTREQSIPLRKRSSQQQEVKTHAPLSTRKTKQGRIKKKQGGISKKFKTIQRIGILTLVCTLLSFGIWRFSKNTIRKKEEKEEGEFKITTKNAPDCRALDPQSIQFTLVTQLSSDRIWMLPHHCERWGITHPISLAIFTDMEILDILSQITPHCNPESLTIQTLPTIGIPTDEYPVNKLRNMALSKVRTSHVLYVDVDFWESENLYDVLQHSESIKHTLASDPQTALVIPAMSIARMCAEYRDCREENIASMPRTKKDLMDLLRDRLAGSFDPTNRGGHGSTDYKRWVSQDEADLYTIPCIQSNRYEPYLAFSYCSSLPPFQETFTGYGKNKMTWVMQLRRYGYIFKQVGGVYVVHYPHLDSKSRLKWNEMEVDGKRADELQESDLMTLKRAQVDKMFVRFREWLYGNVEDRSRVEMCEERSDDDYKLWVH